MAPLRSVNSMTTEIISPMPPSGSALEAANGTPQHGSGDVFMPPAQPDDLTKPFLEYMRGAGGSIDHRCAAALQWVFAS